ncbi:hypothetical protein PybrP1_009322 [[Pythium] brassicae (nom. inval.)]|nr:hypothetical protein PybrP1_009322 [[Pythium] brassicae (nom. inval.)]
MQVTGGWQCAPGAAVTAVDACRAGVTLALEAADGSFVRVRRPEAADVELDGGHAARVTCVRAFHRSPRSRLTLCSASSDRVVVWQVQDSEPRVAQTCVWQSDGQQPEPESSAAAFDHSGALLVLAAGRVVRVFVIERSEVLLTLEGHVAKVTKCEFHPIRHHVLITCSEDRTFKVWDLAAKALLFQSAVLSASAILSLATNAVSGDFAIGFADGTVRTFALLENFAKEMASVSVESFLRRAAHKQQRREEIEELLQVSPNVVSSLPPWARSEEAQLTAQVQALCLNPGSGIKPGSRLEAATSNDFKSDIAYPVLSLAYFCSSASSSCTAGDSDNDDNPRAHFSSHGEQTLLEWEQFLVVGTPRHVLSVNAFSFEVAVLHDLQAPVEGVRGALAPIAVAKEFCFHHEPRELVCGVASAFEPLFTAVSCALVGAARRLRERPDAPATQELGGSSSHSARISVLPTEPPPADSVLNLPSLAVVAGAKLPTKAKRLDKPVTFHARVKSSGYGSAAPFGQLAKARASIRDRKTGAGRPPAPAPALAFLKEYPVQCGLLQHFQQQHALPRQALHQGAIHYVEYSSDAKWLATSGSDRVAQVCKLPFSRFGGEGNVFVGHDSAVKTIRFSQSNQMVVTTAADKSARVWLADSDVASLTLHGVPPGAGGRKSPSKSFTLSSAAKKSRGSGGAGGRLELVDAQFFYMDKFVLSGCGSAVRLHQFELDELFARAQAKQAARNDVAVPENRSRKRKVAEWPLAGMQSVTALACVNGSFLSSVILAAGSDRSLRILDAAAGGRPLRVISDAHTRAAHSLALPRASCYTSHPPNFYDLLLSSAAASATHLWDIRADNCVMRFSEHVNRVHALAVAFSPCMRFVATGSEDRMAYVYDIRTGRCLKRLGGHTDVVTGVAFNPLYPQLATASYDGTVRFYCDSEST